MKFGNSLNDGALNLRPLFSLNLKILNKKFLFHKQIISSENICHFFKELNNESSYNLDTELIFYRATALFLFSETSYHSDAPSFLFSKVST